MQKQKIIVSISSGFIWRVLLVVLAVWFLYSIKSVLILFFLSLIVVSAAAPLVDKLQTKKIPRTVTTLGLYILLFIIIFYLVYLVIPVIISEFNLLAQNLPNYLEGITQFFNKINRVTSAYQIEFNLQKFSENITNQITASTSNIFSNTVAFFGDIFNVFVVLSLSFYMLVKKEATKTFIQTIVPARHQNYAVDLANRIQYKMGRWLIGQLMLIVIIFALDYLALLSLNVPYALILALIGGFLEIIPYVGPTIAIIPAALVGFTVSPWVSLLVIILYIFIQQLENYFITPMVMRKAVGLNPVVVILALLIGAKVAGLIGVLVSVPVATAIGVFMGDLLSKEAETPEEELQPELTN